MTPQQFIEERLAALRMPDKTAQPDDIVEAIYAIVMSKKFRKYSCTPEQQAGIRRIIELQVKNNKLIRFDFPFGGYKLWRLEEAPEADWAELFTMLYCAKWVKPICDIYEPGILFEFSSEELVIGRMNNLTDEELQAYTQSFQSLIELVNTHVPSNMRFALTFFRDYFDGNEHFEKELTASMEKHMAQHNGAYRTLPPEEIKSIEMNVRLTSEQEKDPKWREKIDLIHYAFYDIPLFDQSLMEPDKIIVFTTPLPEYLCVAVGSTKTSIAKFWAGVGALQKRGDSYIETVLSPSQLAAAKFDWQPVTLPGLEGKNFERVRVL